MKVSLKLENPLKVANADALEKALGGDYDQRPDEGLKRLKELGFDSVILAGGDEIIATSPSQIKSADPITRDDAGNVIPLSQRFQSTSPDIRYMPSDSDYMAAVKSGDTAKAQELVDQAAKAAGYTIGPVFHGTKSQFNEFQQTREVGGDEYGKGFYFSELEGVASRYGDRVIPAYLSIKNPVKVGGAFADGDLWKKVQAEKRSDIATNAKKMGYDGVIRFQRGIDDSEMLEIVAFDPSQIKSADPITYDNSGNIIPLSQRFQQSSADIRYMPAPVPDPSIPGAYSMSGYRILPGKTKGKLRIYSPSGSLVGVFGSVDDAQRMIRKKLQ
jgi:hypothetical protein